MKKTQLLAVGALLLGGVPRVASAQLLTFDNLIPPAQFVSVPNGYQGFNWLNTFVLNTTNNPFVPVAAASTPNVIFPGNGDPSGFTIASSGTFTLGSIDFIGWAPFGGAPAGSTTVTGFNGGTQLFHVVVPLGTSYATTVFNWAGVDRVTFNQSNTGWYVADNVVIGRVGGPPPPTTTPEPGSLTLLGTGLAALVVARAARRTRG